jgi:hypothetical protein
VFGNPLNNQWKIQFYDGQIATIYSDSEKSSIWKIGGMDKEVLFRIHQLVMR